MRHYALACLLTLFCVTPAHAEPYSIKANGDLVFNTALSTSGTFTCGWSASCSGSGTNAITLHSTTGDLSLSFSGVDLTAEVGNVASPLTLGTFSGLDTGYSAPSANPYVPVVLFSLSLTHSSPQTYESVMRWGFNAAMHRVGGGTYMEFPSGPTPDGYAYCLIYSLGVVPLVLPTNGSRDLTADVGAAPEPASLMLFGSGLVGLVARQRRRKQREDN